MAKPACKPEIVYRDRPVSTFTCATACEAEIQQAKETGGLEGMAMVGLVLLAIILIYLGLAGLFEKENDA